MHRGGAARVRQSAIKPSASASRTASASDAGRTSRRGPVTGVNGTRPGVSDSSCRRRAHRRRPSPGRRRIRRANAISDSRAPRRRLRRRRLGDQMLRRPAGARTGRAILPAPAENPARQRGCTSLLIQLELRSGGRHARIGAGVPGVSRDLGDRGNCLEFDLGRGHWNWKNCLLEPEGYQTRPLAGHPNPVRRHAVQSLVLGRPRRHAFAGLHNPLDAARIADVRGRIVGEQHQIGEAAGLNQTHVI